MMVGVFANTMPMTDKPIKQKADDALRTIGELSAELRIKPHILRYWEEQFPTLRPLKRAGGRRHYRAKDVELVRTIDRLLNQEGFTIRGARKYLADVRRGVERRVEHNFPTEPLVNAGFIGASAEDSATAELIDQLRDVRAFLAQALARA
jgi:DNA-binding transcriptional MerR regulator